MNLDESCYHVANHKVLSIGLGKGAPRLCSPQIFSAQPAEATNRSLIFQHTWKAAGWAIMENLRSISSLVHDDFFDGDGDGNAWWLQAVKICVFVAPISLYNMNEYVKMC